MFRLFFAAALAAYGQTQIDAYRQVLPATKPVKVGSVFPALCVQGDLFVKTDAPLGLNLYACVSANTWTLESGGGGGGGGTFTLEADGVTVGARSILNILQGTGIIDILSDTGSELHFQHSVDTATVETRANLQSGTDLRCASASGSATAYTCSLAPTLTGYATGMSLNWVPDISGSGGATTLSVDALGAVPVKLSDGTTDPTDADLIAGQLYQIWYDGAKFRLLVPKTLSMTSASGRPACSVTQRGRMWHILGGAGTKDEVAVCAKDAGDAYAWRILF